MGRWPCGIWQTGWPRGSDAAARPKSAAERRGVVPLLQSEDGVATFFREHRGQPFASSVLMEPISRRFRGAVDAFV